MSFSKVGLGVFLLLLLWVFVLFYFLISLCPQGQYFTHTFTFFHLCFKSVIGYHEIKKKTCVEQCQLILLSTYNMTGVIPLLTLFYKWKKLGLRQRMRSSQDYSICLYRTELECRYWSVNSEPLLGQVRTDLEWSTQLTLCSGKGTTVVIHNCGSIVLWRRE